MVDSRTLFNKLVRLSCRYYTVIITDARSIGQYLMYIIVIYGYQQLILHDT